MKIPVAGQYKQKTDKMKREEILKEVSEERNRQDLKFGEQNHTPIEWVTILVEEVGEVSKDALEHHFAAKKGINNKDPEKSLKNCRKELVQVAAVAVSMIESLDRNELKPEEEEEVFKTHDGITFKRGDTIFRISKVETHAGVRGTVERLDIRHQDGDYIRNVVCQKEKYEYSRTKEGAELCSEMIRWKEGDLYFVKLSSYYELRYASDTFGVFYAYQMRKCDKTVTSNDFHLAKGVKLPE